MTHLLSPCLVQQCQLVLTCGHHLLLLLLLLSFVLQAWL
jgi:hypothetical protein